MAAPCVLVASCTNNFEPITLVKEIASVENLPQSTKLIEDIHAYPWHVDTKYYTADVLLCTTGSRTIGNKEFAESVEAVLLYFDGNDKASFNQVKSWIPFVKEINPEVRLLVCERSLTSHVMPRQFIQEWCLDYNFELVELDPEEQAEDVDLEDDFPDSFGTKRIIQALHAHTWRNMKMKENPNIRSPYFQNLMNEQAAENAKEAQETLVQSSSSTETELTSHETESSDRDRTPIADDDPDQVHTDSDEGKSSNGTASKDCSASSGGTDSKTTKQPKGKTKNDVIDSMLNPEDDALFEALSSHDEDWDSFEKLFSQLVAMKERSSQLPQEERKAYAEKMALSFWKAVGGDEEEIANLSDSSDD